MRKFLSTILVLVVCVVGLQAQQKQDAAANLRSLVETERSFAKMSETANTRDAFVAFLADDSIIFRPGPVNAKQSWQARAVNQGLLTWKPIFADISRAGDMGYTTGPWEFREDRNKRDAQAVAYGNFMTVWKRQADGTWKVALDNGISNPAPTSTLADWQLPANYKGQTGKAKSSAEVEAARSALLKMEQNFSDASMMQGAAKAFQNYLANDARWLRDGEFPVTGKASIAAAMLKTEGVLTWQAMKADASQSADLGYTYGTYEIKATDARGRTTEKGYYVRIWKKQSDGQWKVVLDVFNPLPPDKQ